MSQLSDTQRAALNVEEAALLPALPRTRATVGDAALRSALRAANEMNEMQLSNLVSAQIAPERTVAEEIKPTYRRAGSRAALHHVMRR